MRELLNVIDGFARMDLPNCAVYRFSTFIHAAKTCVTYCKMRTHPNTFNRITRVGFDREVESNSHKNTSKKVKRNKHELRHEQGH